MSAETNSCAWDKPTFLKEEVRVVVTPTLFYGFSSRHRLFRRLTWQNYLKKIIC